MRFSERASGFEKQRGEERAEKNNGKKIEQYFREVFHAWVVCWLFLLLMLLLVSEQLAQEREQEQGEELRTLKNFCANRKSLRCAMNMCGKKRPPTATDAKCARRNSAARGVFNRSSNTKSRGRITTS